MATGPDESARGDGGGGPRLRARANGWPVLPFRLFLAAVFLFAGYAQLSYRRWFDEGSDFGLRSVLQSAKDSGSPIGGVLQPLINHPSLYGHISAYAEIAIGLGLLVGLLTRLAALGGIVITVLIVLSIHWGGVREYTGSSGWFTSVDIAVAAGLSVFLLGGADPLSLDNLVGRWRAKRRTPDEREPGYDYQDPDASLERLRGGPTAMQPLPLTPPAWYGPPETPSEPAIPSEPDDADRSAGAAGAAGAVPTGHDESRPEPGQQTQRLPALDPAPAGADRQHDEPAPDRPRRDATAASANTGPVPDLRPGVQADIETDPEPELDPRSLSGDRDAARTDRG